MHLRAVILACASTCAACFLVLPGSNMGQHPRPSHGSLASHRSPSSISVSRFRKILPSERSERTLPNLVAADKSECFLSDESPSSDVQLRASRRRALAIVTGAVFGAISPAWAQPAVIQKGDPLPEGAQAPTEEQINDVRSAIEAYNNQDLARAEKLFSSSIEAWESLQRPRDEKAELYKFRANARVDLKRFEDALVDYNTVLSLMGDGEKPDGTARYMEYPDTYVQRGLCYEGLYKWEEAVEDYNRAVKLWGGGRGRGVNPYVLTFRANALGQLGRYKESLQDYQAAERLFLERRDQERALDSRANYALALYETGQTAEAVKVMREIVVRRQGYTDMHVALAAVGWAEGRREEAESEWETACDRISSGCRKYKDMEWVRTVRRWPPSLADQLASFLAIKESAPVNLKLPLPGPIIPTPGK